MINSGIDGQLLIKLAQLHNLPTKQRCVEWRA